MLQSGVAGDRQRIAGHVVAGVLQPIPHLVVFAAPAPELVTEPVHSGELLLRQGWDSSEYIVVWQPKNRAEQKKNDEGWREEGEENSFNEVMRMEKEDRKKILKEFAASQGTGTLDYG